MAFEIRKGDWITEHEPDRDGMFLVACGYSKDINLTNMNYTTDGGWNTTRSENGTLSDNHRDEGPFWGGYIRAWMEMPKWEEDHE